MISQLLLLSGNDIPFMGGQTTIHQPSIKEIAYIGEETFFIGCEFLKFSKDKLTFEDKIHLESLTNFDIIMSMIIQTEEKDNEMVNSAKSVLSLLFPDYSVDFMLNRIVFFLENVDGEHKIMFSITNENFDEFQNILCTIFNLGEKEKEEFNPAGDMAKKIADKLKKGRNRAAAAKGESKKKGSVFGRYISILAVGEQKNINDLMNYTIYQLLDEFQRYQLKLTFDSYVQAKMAGAQDLKEVDNWMKDIHE